jgi:glycosyltransferase involved in cell wall biosynthesis
VRICHVSPHLPPDQAANALLPAELAAWSVAAGDAVAFVTQPPTQGGRATGSLPGPVAYIAARTRSRLKRLLRIDTIARARSIVAALDRVASDVELLHLHSNGLIIEVAASWARRRNVPYVLTLYGTEIWHFKRRWPIDPFVRAYVDARAVTFYSRKLMERAIEAGLGRDQLAVVYPAVASDFRPVDVAEREAMRLALGIKEPRIILNVKRLHPLAAQADLIDAFADVARHRTGVRLVICGTGPLANALRERATAAGVAAQVTFAGLVPNQDVARYAAVADVFALPSRLEALPTVAVEALAAGTPVVSADHPGGLELHDIFGDDVAVVRGGDVGGLCQALSARVDEPRRARPETAALVERHFSRRAIHAAYEAVYRQAIL